MTENKSTLDDRNKQTNEGANDDRLKPMNEEQRDIATTGGKAAPTPKRDVPSQPRSEDDQSAENDTSGDQRQENSDDEINTRGGIMGGASKRGSRNSVQ